MQITALEAVRDRLMSEFHDLDAKRAEHQELQARLPGLREQVVNAESDLQQVKARSDRLVNDVSSLEQQRETLAKDIAVLQQQQDNLESAKTAFALLKTQHSALEEEVTRLLARKELLERETGSSGPVSLTRSNCFRI